MKNHRKYIKHPELQNLSRKEYKYKWLKKRRQENKEPQRFCPCCGQLIINDNSDNSDNSDN